jgi:nitrite reductase/ring-hydroxylating ferredoxin subunit
MKIGDSLLVFIVGLASGSSAFVPGVSPPGYSLYTFLSAKKEVIPKEEGTSRAFVGSLSSVFQRGNIKEQETGPPRENGGFFARLAKRFGGISEEKPQKEVPKGTLEQWNRRYVKEAKSNIVAEVFETVDEVKLRARAAKSSAMLVDMVRSGNMLPREEEEIRLKEIQGLMVANYKKQDMLRKAKKEIQREMAGSTISQADRREAFEKVLQQVEGKIQKAQEQREFYLQQQKLVRIAAGKLPKESLSLFLEKPQKAVDERSAGGETRRLDFPFFGRSGNETAIEKDNEEKSGLNPLSGAQRLFSGLWEVAFGKQDQWVVAFPKSRIDPGEIVPINIAGIDLLVVASRDGRKVYCIANSCSHLGTPLETGVLQRRKSDRPVPDSPDGCEECIVCPLHQTAFALETGEVNGEWCPYPPVLGKMMGAVKAKSPVAVFDIRTRGKNIEVKINSRLDDENSTPRPLLSEK